MPNRDIDEAIRASGYRKGHDEGWKAGWAAGWAAGKAAYEQTPNSEPTRKA